MGNNKLSVDIFSLSKTTETMIKHTEVLSVKLAQLRQISVKLHQSENADSCKQLNMMLDEDIDKIECFLQISKKTASQLIYSLNTYIENEQKAMDTVKAISQ